MRVSGLWPSRRGDGPSLWALALFLCLTLLPASKSSPPERASPHEHQSIIEPRIKRRAAPATGALAPNQAPSAAPEFSAPIGNITAVLGRDVRLVCTVENLGQYQVAWLKETDGGQTLLSIDTNIIITNYRIFLIPDEEERKWVLHIKDVQESDRGFYRCQVNTSPMRSTSGYLEVVVPPSIVESHTSQVVELVEHSNATIQCKASGHPKPMISWHREDGQPIRLSGSRGQLTTNHSSHQLIDVVKSDKLTLTDVDRTMAGLYVCVASNGIPTQVSKRIPLFVKFAPKVTVHNKYISVSLNEQLEVDCLIEAHPKANSYWSKQKLQQQQAPLRHPDDLFGGAQRWASGALVAAEADGGAISYRRNKPIYEQILSMASDGHQWLQSNASDDDMMLEQDSSDKATTTTLNRSTSSAVDSTTSQQRANYGQYVSVKLIPINSYTYKLRLTIARMHLRDYGEYICISSNLMGHSEAHVIVTRADKLELDKQKGVVESATINDSDQDSEYQRDSLIDTSGPTATSFVKSANNHNTGMGPQRNRNTHQTNNRVVVYDENYLQAIKSRAQASGSPLISGSKLQEKLRMKPYGNGGSSRKFPQQWIAIYSIIFVHIINLIQFVT